MLAKTALRLVPTVKIDTMKYYGAAAAVLHSWRQRRREREELARMTERDLKDIGLTPADQRWISRQPFWKYYPFAEERGPAHGA